jgi:cytochrome c peroxidase
MARACASKAGDIGFSTLLAVEREVCINASIEQERKMNAGLNSFLIVGIAAILLGVATIAYMIRREIGPFGGLAGGTRWMLAGAFGLGIIAFTVKLTVIATLSNAHQAVIDPLIADRPLIDWNPLAGRNDTGGDVTPPAGRYVWQALPAVAPAPADNPTTPEKVALGKRLFFDKNLSNDRKLNCASCHDVEGGSGGDGHRTATGINGVVGGRNSPTVWNTAFQSVLFWDGRAASLEEQASGPMMNPIEMGMPSAAVVEERVRKDAAYPEAFARAFGADSPITISQIVAAIAAYERTLITPDAPYDRFIRGDKAALNAAQLRGMALFESVGCVSCHSGPNFSGASFLGTNYIGFQAPLRMFPTQRTVYEARYPLTRDLGGAPKGSDRGVWRIPSLRNVALTGPYLHNGSVDTLQEMVRIMASAQLGVTISNETHPDRVVGWSPQGKVTNSVDRPILNDRDVNDIVAFLNALSSDELVARIAKSKSRSVAVKQTKAVVSPGV